MKGRRGYTLIEMVTVAGLGLVICSLAASLHLTITRAVEVELARTKMVAAAREVTHYLKSDVRRADSLAVSGGELTLVMQGEAITYSNSGGGIRRQAGTGARLLGDDALKVAFRPLGGRGLEATISGERSVRSRTIKVHREIAIGRRQL